MVARSSDGGEHWTTLTRGDTHGNVLETVDHTTVTSTLTRVTFPLILPALLSAMTLVFVISIGIFGVAAILVIGAGMAFALLAPETYRGTAAEKACCASCTSCSTKATRPRPARS